MIDHVRLADEDVESVRAVDIRHTKLTRLVRLLRPWIELDVPDRAVADGDDAVRHPWFVGAWSMRPRDVSERHRRRLGVGVPPLGDVWLVPPSNDEFVVDVVLAHATDREVALARELFGFGHGAQHVR